jgi:hypothetical protein
MSWIQLPLLADVREAGMSQAERDEWARCALSFAYWLDTFGRIYDPAARGWTPFRLWPAQLALAEQLQAGGSFVILKARQMGLTWLVAGHALWLMLFRPASTALLFSRRDDEAVHLLKSRLRGMYDRLPAWMQAPGLDVDNDHAVRLSNGSAALAFPTTGGRSYTASFALVDEADHVPDLDRLLDAVKPTVDAGGRLVLLSTADKDRPGSPFKRIYEAAQTGRNDYTPVFLPWHARPDRTQAWYDAIRRDFEQRDGCTDSLFGEYPATDVEALAGRALDRRFPAAWLAACDGTAVQEGMAALSPAPLLPPSLASGLPGITVYAPPQEGRSYLIGADPAEGNPQSDESAASCIDADTGEQVAVIAGRYEPGVFAALLLELSDWCNAAPILVERNNHGHAVLLWLAAPGPAHGPAPGPEHGAGRVLDGRDGRPGWLTTGQGKALAYNAAAAALRDRATIIRDRATLQQLMSIRGATLAAPPGEADDRATAHVLALAARVHCTPVASEAQSVIIAPEPLDW